LIVPVFVIVVLAEKRFWIVRVEPSETLRLLLFVRPPVLLTSRMRFPVLAVMVPLLVRFRFEMVPSPVMV
jgi:hypothetical protein